MKEYAFGIDLGGTTAKVGLFTTSGALLEKWEVPTNTANKGEKILPNLAAAIQDKMAQAGIKPEQVEGVGIGVPGPVQEASIVPIVCANLGGWGQQNVAAQLSGLLDGLKVMVGNDANVAALGEIWMGTAKGCRSAVMVTLGTGVGGGVIVNGQVIDGAHGAGGEIGHITVNRHETATCGCGKRGCLEQYSSATGVVRCMKKLLEENPDTPCVLRGTDFAAKDVFDAAREGDALAAREVDEMADTLGLALSIIAETTDPEIFLVGGGVARAGDVLFNPLIAHYKEYAFRSCKETPIKQASLGNDAGIYGAVRLIVGAEV
ncbi:MAG TPA: ROK family glucokinase [Candidatus Faecalibacterium intestinipullorum]|nr:ROK family glucokinase [Candidatus Faecalibacterium intestinipullorum]